MPVDLLQDEGLTQFLYLAPVGLVQAQLDGTIEMCNPMSAQLLMPIVRDGGLDNLFEVLSPYAPQLRRLVEDFVHPTGVICDGLRFAIPPTPGDASSRFYALHLTRIDDDRVMAVLSDVSHEVEREKRDLDRRLHEAARVDVLTAMPNRIAVRELLAQTLALSSTDDRHCAVLLIGGERLQQLADSFGSSVRDEVLHVMALRLTTVLRPSDCLSSSGAVDQYAAHVGGDEFVVLLRHLSKPDDATAVARRVLDALTKPYVIGAVPLHCAFSIGVMRPTGQEDDADGVLRAAAIALGEAKRAGGSRVVSFEKGMRERAVQRGHLEIELRRALTNDELFVVYQPVVDLQTADTSPRLAAVEALVRWRHPERGIVPPIEFIGLAEETGLIAALGRFVLTTACRDFAAWSDAFGDRSPRLLAVNLSRAQLDDAGLIDSVREAVRGAGMPMARLQLEITESLAAEGDVARAQLQALKQLGLKLALDDFGTGYSSLSSLHLLPVDTVKIDRSFVTLVEASPHHRVLIEATIKVARSLGMSTVAEGIETAHQSSIVRELGCDKGQGYHYSRPLPAQQLHDWLGEYSASASLSLDA